MLYAMAQQAQPAQGGSPLLTVVPIIIIFLIFYLILILPQQRKQKEHQKLLGSLKRGDSVVTSGGIHGQVTKVGEGTMTIKVSEKCELVIDKSSVSKVT